MNATFKVLCYKSKTLSNGENPLMICVSKEGKRKYVSLGISVNPKFWDFAKNEPKRNCPNKELIKRLIIEQEQKYSKQILEYSIEDRDYSLTTIVNEANSVTKSKTVEALFHEYIKLLENENRIGYALSVKQVYRSLIKYTGSLDFYFSEITVKWLRDYEAWLRSNQIADNTIGIRLRTLRVIYNYAITEGAVKNEYYPFKKYKVSKLHKTTAKRAITKEQIIQIMNYDTSSSCFYKKLAIDLFSFSYLMGGINFTDMAMLQGSNLLDGKLVYVRQKTKKQIVLPISEEALAIIKKYENSSCKYLFPILDNRKRTPMQIKDRIYDVLSNINRHLEKIGKALHIQLKLTTYVARHSYATVLKRSGVSTAIISESLGHSSEKVTQIYLDSFDNEQLFSAMKNLL